ncbi:1430_t:CDS:1 [Funneliformis geosporum]|uniref:1623_t:CDS:1 n=1 Tax=Funneliformis geosporum TaxID=1117311 RepID=A0A9W4WUR8_9GLOM|nr:1623_t:CDS:1 [Funneliformis geosporum]CAI2177051.1 1430_t:CDS:1 [Funneliformis geosporum]
MAPLVNKTKTSTSPLVNKNRNGLMVVNNDKAITLNNKTRTNNTRVRWRLCEAPQHILEKVNIPLYAATNAVNDNISRVRWILAEAPQHILDKIKPPEFAIQNTVKDNRVPLSSSNTAITMNDIQISNNIPPLMANNTTKLCSQHQRNNRRSLRKQPYPRRAPNSSSEDGYVIRVNIYEVYKRNPKLLSKTLKEVKKIEKKEENPFVLRLEDLMAQINDLDIDQSTMNFTSPKITWKKGSSSLEIKELEGANLLHKEEWELCSKLRMPPLQYLRGKLAILRGAGKARRDHLKFKKVDAQRLVNFDVNKACKLWEFFDQLGWI